MADAERCVALVAACRMWCEAKGLEPIPISREKITVDGTDLDLMAEALKDFEGGIKDLNEKQRRLIASCA